MIELLIRYYETGDLHDFDTYSIEWLREQNGRIDLSMVLLRSMVTLWD